MANKPNKQTTQTIGWGHRSPLRLHLLCLPPLVRVFSIKPTVNQKIVRSPFGIPFERGPVSLPDRAGDLGSVAYLPELNKLNAQAAPNACADR